MSRLENGIGIYPEKQLSLRAYANMKLAFVRAGIPIPETENVARLERHPGFLKSGDPGDLFQIGYFLGFLWIAFRNEVAIIHRAGLRIQIGRVAVRLPD